jgi:hypothetical protein
MESVKKKKKGGGNSVYAFAQNAAVTALTFTKQLLGSVI